MRANKLSKEDDPRVLQYVNMQTTYDNLYIVCLHLTKEAPLTVQVVQADPYDMWAKAELVDPDVDMINKGEWYCTFLRPYHQDSNEPLNKVRWRYQIHEDENETDDDTKQKFSDGYASFDDHKRRGGFDNDGLLDWSESISLFPYPKGTRLYGPFSWNDRTTKSHKIQPHDWLAALPDMLKCETEKFGPMFEHGFSDSMLMSVAETKKCWLTMDMIDDANRQIQWLTKYQLSTGR
jgi:hypothetical protein